MAYTDFLKPTSVTQTTNSETEISWNLDTSAYNVNTSCSTSEPLTSFNSKHTGLLIFSGWDTSVVPENNNQDGVFVDAFSVKDEETNPHGITFNNDGTKMFICGQSSDRIFEYALTTGFDVSTASYVQRFAASAQDLDMRDVQFSTDGTVMFLLGRGGTHLGSVYRYTLTTGFDVSTATFEDSFDVKDQEINASGLAFSTDGTKMFVLGTSGTTGSEKKVSEYTLSTAFDFSPVTTTVDGIEVKILANTSNRIEDSIVQLAQSGSVVGTNQASTQVTTGNNYTYGDSTSTWGATLTYSDLSTLQVAVKYKSDSQPHRDSAYVYSVQLKIHYT